MNREGSMVNRRTFLVTVGTVTTAGCSGRRSPGSRTSPTGSIETASPRSTPTSGSDRETATPDETAPSVVEARATSEESGIVEVRLVGRDSGGIARVQITSPPETTPAVDRRLDGSTRVEVEETVEDRAGDPRVAEVEFRLEDRAGNVATATDIAYRSAPFGADLRRTLDPLSVPGDPFLGITEPEPVLGPDNTRYLFWRKHDEVALSVLRDDDRVEELGLVIAREDAGGMYDNYVISPSHIEVDGAHYLFFEGNDGEEHESRIGVARAPDLDGPYELIPEPALVATGEGFEQILVGTPAVCEWNGEFYMFYHGWDNESDRAALARAINFPLEWEKSPANPIVDVRPGTWHSNKVAPSDVQIWNDTLYVWLEGHDGTNWRSGLAVTNEPFAGVELADHNPVLGPGETGSFDDLHAHTPAGLVTQREYAGQRHPWLEVYYQGNDGAAYRMGRAEQPLAPR